MIRCGGFQEGGWMGRMHQKWQRETPCQEAPSTAMNFEAIGDWLGSHHLYLSFTSLSTVHQFLNISVI